MYMHEIAVCNTGILYGCCSCLIMGLGQQQRMTQVRGPLCPRGKPEEAHGFWLLA